MQVAHCLPTRRLAHLQTYKLPPMTIFLYTLTVSITILLPIGLAIWFRRRFDAPWWLFLVGVATFIGSQIYHIPLNNWLTDLGIIGAVEKGDPALLWTAIILGLSAGLSETIARAIGYGLLFRSRKASKMPSGIMIGLGHGGIEAMALGGVLLAATIGGLWGIRNTDLTTLELSAAQVTAVTDQLAHIHKIQFIFLPLLERMIAMTFHVVSSLLVWHAFSHKKVGYFLAAAAYHSFFDATAVYASVNLQSIWLVELLLFVMVLPAALFLWRTWRVMEKRPFPPAPIRAELTLFRVALRKELLYQWRTKRVIIVLAVFLLFGFGSPMLAYFTPQLLQNIEGAEMLSGLIPTPTNADALAQYIKNITQFGFIIAVLLGMGAIAGEKEKGTTAMVLSKPLPRWAFIMSKFVAQTAVYLIAFLLAGLAAAYYTSLLFEPWALGQFLFGNLLLLIWLLVYTAVTILGSTVGKTTGAAAGISLAGAILLLISGTIPKWSPFTPSGLVGWASQLGLDSTIGANPGGLAANIVLILMLLLTAVAVFETQEL